MCSICREEIVFSSDLASFGCGHIFHHDCIVDFHNAGGAEKCPFCRAPIQAVHEIQPDFDEIILTLRSMERFSNMIGGAGGIVRQMLDMFRPVHIPVQAVAPQNQPPAQNVQPAQNQPQAQNAQPAQNQNIPANNPHQVADADRIQRRRQYRQIMYDLVARR